MIGYTDLPGRLPTQSSQLYGTNLVNLLKLLCKEHIEMFLKYFTEILDVTESRHLGYFGDGVLSGL